ncbi:MAG: GNAT family N-acetyltransferase [Anaerolineales bacterium]
MIIKNGSLSIRNAGPDDAGLLCSWWNDGKVMAHAGYPNGIGISKAEALELLEKDNDLQRRLILELENEPIGEMNYRTLEERTAEIGIKICDFDQQNKGYGSEFLRMLMDYLFVKKGYSKVILDTNLKNERAQLVYERLGFQKVRTNINKWRDQLGEMQSSVDYEMTKEVYQQLYRD